MVQLNGCKLVFQRATSYLPYWETPSGQWSVPEIIPRKGDGPANRPDKNNIYAYVRLIESNDDSILVHYRYFPNFALGSHASPIGGNVGFDGVVHEYYTIYVNNTLKRVVRKGTRKTDDWNDPLNRTIQYIQLSDNGMTLLKTITPSLSKLPGRPVEGTPIKSVKEEIDPSLIWHFDEGLESLSCHPGSL